MMNKTIRAILLAAGLFGAAVVSAAEFYVSPTGSDEARGDIDTPLRSIAHAVGKMRPGDTVFLRGGRYHERVELDGLKGSVEKPYVIQAYPGEKVTLDGSVPIDGPGKGRDVMQHWPAMLRDYYREMGWDEETGRPLPGTLEKLGLEGMA